MEEKKLTDEEIVKALEHCGSQHHIKGCKDCPMKGIENCYDEPLTDNALDLIHRLQGDKKELEESCELFKHFNEKHCETISEQKAEIERLTEELVNYIRKAKFYYDKCKDYGIENFYDSELEVE